MHNSEYKDLDRFDVLAIGLMEAVSDLSIGRLILVMAVGGPALTVTAFLVARALI